MLLKCVWIKYFTLFLFFNLLVSLSFTAFYYLLWNYSIYSYLLEFNISCGYTTFQIFSDSMNALTQSIPSSLCAVVMEVIPHTHMLICVLFLYKYVKSYKVSWLSFSTVGGQIHLPLICGFVFFTPVNHWATSTSLSFWRNNLLEFYLMSIYWWQILSFFGLKLSFFYLRIWRVFFFFSFHEIGIYFH